MNKKKEKSELEICLDGAIESLGDLLISMSREYKEAKVCMAKKATLFVMR